MAEVREQIKQMNEVDKAELEETFEQMKKLLGDTSVGNPEFVEKNLFPLDR